MMANTPPPRRSTAMACRQSQLDALVWAVLSTVVADGCPRDRREPRGAKDMLAERFAKGEIDAGEYRERLHTLEGKSSGPADNQ